MKFGKSIQKDSYLRGAIGLLKQSKHHMIEQSTGSVRTLRLTREIDLFLKKISEKRKKI